LIEWLFSLFLDILTDIRLKLWVITIHH
jgi:hypothetical protein